MIRSLYATAAILTAAASLAAPLDAQAGSRLHFNYFNYEPGYQTYYPGPLYVPRPRYYYYYDYDPDPPYAYEYEPDYYEPTYEPRRYQRPVRPYVSRKQKPITASKSKVQQKALVNEELEATEVQPEPVKKKAAGISCDKAAKIVAEYGFQKVKAANCTGLVYSFKGNRDGKSYAIKLSAKSGELTEVKKL
jgi:hypothetical protein